jgi:hypothetical protein
MHEGCSGVLDARRKPPEEAPMKLTSFAALASLLAAAFTHCCLNSASSFIFPFIAAWVFPIQSFIVSNSAVSAPK